MPSVEKEKKPHGLMDVTISLHDQSEIADRLVVLESRDAASVCVCVCFFFARPSEAGTGFLCMPLADQSCVSPDGSAKKPGQNAQQFVVVAHV